jgi:hypothetical protein
MAKPPNGAPANAATDLEEGLRDKSATTSSMHSQSQSPLFRLPGEIRNRIYHHALEMRLIRFSRQSVPDSSALRFNEMQEHLNQDASSTNLLLVCKAIFSEAGSLFAESALAEIDLQALARLNQTAKHALDTFMNVSITYPIDNEMKMRPGRHSRRVTNGQYGWALYRALKLYTRASARLCAERQLRRKATIGYGLRWPTRTQFVRSLRDMARDKYTYWTVEMQYEFHKTGEDSEFDELRYIAWARDEVDKLGKRISLSVTLFHCGPAKRSLPLLGIALGHRGIRKGEMLDSVSVGGGWYAVELSL